MVKPELGIKRTCPNCAVRFYDLLKDPITCPKCSTSFVAMAILPSKTDFPGAVPQPAPKVRDTEDAEEESEVELVSLSEVEEDEKADDETAGIPDVDLGEDAAGDDDEEDDTFLVEEEEGSGNLADLVEGGGKEDEEEN